MRKSLILKFLIFCLVIWSAWTYLINQETKSKKNNLIELDEPVIDLNPGSVPLIEYLSLAEAEKILGESAHLKDSNSTINDLGSKYQKAYIANSIAGDLARVIYFSLTDFKQPGAAEEKFLKDKNSNKDLEGFEYLSTIGEEAFFHTDGQNFGILQTRKGNKLLVLKVNKLSKLTSIQNLKKIAQSIVQNL